jgi:hypothetical protein
MISARRELERFHRGAEHGARTNHRRRLACPRVEVLARPIGKILATPFGNVAKGVTGREWCSVGTSQV